MGASFIAVLASGALTVALAALFRYEKMRGVRYAQDIRTQCDRVFLDAKLRIEQRYRETTTQTIRQSAHYVFHRGLTAALRMIQRLEQCVRSIARFNKNRANRRHGATPSPHFSALADHKRETALSPAEKRQKQDEALNGS